MGRSYTPAYRLEIWMSGKKLTSFAERGPSIIRMAWKTKDYGKPTEANLAKVVTDYGNSFKADGVNAHIGTESMPIGGRIVDQRMGRNTGRNVCAYNVPLDFQW